MPSTRLAEIEPTRAGQESRPYRIVDCPIYERAGYVRAKITIFRLRQPNSALRNGGDHTVRMELHLPRYYHGGAIRMFTIYWKTLPVYDLTYFRDLAAVVNDEPAQERDAVMLGLLASIGIERASPSIRPASRRARSSAPLRKPTRRCRTTSRRRARRSSPTGRTANGWPAHHTQKQDFTFVVDGKLLVDERAGGFALWATWLPKKLGAASAYPTALRDGAGKLLSGQNNLSASVPADTPARDFWSVIAYSMKTKSMIPNPQNRVGLSSYDKSKLSMNADGSVDLYFGSDRAAWQGSKLAPTGEDFFLILRLYGPGKAYFDKTWKMNDIEQVN